MLHMLNLLLVFLLNSVLVSGYEQHDYILIFERGEVVRSNPKYYQNSSIRTFKYNRTQAVVNVSAELKMDLGNILMVKFQGYKFASNEYRLFPLVFERNVCNVLNSDEFGLQNIYKCGNKAPICPLKKGSYKICNWYPEQSKLPPFIPIGSYKLELTYMYRSEEVLVMNLYGTVRHLIQRK